MGIIFAGRYPKMSDRYVLDKNLRIYRVKETPETSLIYRGTNYYGVFDVVDLCDRDLCIDDVIKEADTIGDLFDDIIIKACVGEIGNFKHFHVGSQKELSRYELSEELGEFACGGFYSFDDSHRLVFRSVATAVFPKDGKHGDGRVDWEF